jgi:hypothetical protein
MVIKMNLFRKTMQSIYRKIYNFIFCISKVSPIPKTNEFCDNCREYLLNQGEDDSTISDLDYNKIYVDSAKIDNFLEKN